MIFVKIKIIIKNYKRGENIFNKKVILLISLILLILTIGFVSAADSDKFNKEDIVSGDIRYIGELDSNLSISTNALDFNDSTDVVNSSNNDINNSNDTLTNSTLNSTNVTNINETNLNSNNTFNISNTTSNNSSNVTKYFTIKEITTYAVKFKKYCDKYSKLPNTITISNTKIYGYQFVFLMSQAIQKINGDDSSKIKLVNVKLNDYYGSLIYKDISKNTYLLWANKVIQNVNSTNYLPKALRNGESKVDYSTYAYSFSKILNYYNSFKILPKSCHVEKMTQTKGKIDILGSSKYGSVEFIGPIGNKSSKVKIAYVIGVHVREFQAHDALWTTLNSKANSLKCCYYVYRIKLSKVSGDYSIDRLRGQILSRDFILPHAKKQNYKLLIDVHSSLGPEKGGSYKYNYFIFVPGNTNKLAKSWANKIISKSVGMVYYYPSSQTSPPYMTLPLIKSGTPTLVFETLTEEVPLISLSRLNSLVSVVDKLFVR